jgi:hypothetical protein
MTPERVPACKALTPVTEPHPTRAGHRVRLRSRFALLALLASLADADASTCFPSAAAVRQESPQAWPSWTLRAPGHEGTKCWYASTRTRAPDHQNQIMQREEKIGITETLQSQSTTNGYDARPHAATATIDAVSLLSPTPQASFADRFSAVFEGVFEGNPSVEWTKIQRVLDLFRSAR